MLLRFRQHDTLERQLQHARVLVQTLLDERDLARRERDDAVAVAARLRDEILTLEAEGIANDPNLWRAMADRSADEATAYARQLVAHKIEPDRDFGTQQ